MLSEDIMDFCLKLAEEMQTEFGDDVDIKFYSKKDMWFIVSCQYYNPEKGDYIDITSRLDVNQGDEKQDIESSLRKEVKSLLDKKRILEEKG